VTFIDDLATLANDLATHVSDFVAHIDDTSTCEDVASINGFAAHVDNTRACKLEGDISVNGFTAHVSNTSAFKGFVLINGIVALINSIAAFVNGVMALANDPLHLQLHLQSTLGSYPFVSMFFRPSKFPDLSFLKGTTCLPFASFSTIRRFSWTAIIEIAAGCSYGW